MKLWKTVVIGAAAAVALVVGANLAVGASSTGDRPGVVDISGPCDEAEHANDPECSGVTVPGAQRDHADDRMDDRRDDGDEDNSGPSANSGPGNADDEGRDDDGGGDDDDSGPGSDDD